MEVFIYTSMINLDPTAQSVCEGKKAWERGCTMLIHDMKQLQSCAKIIEKTVKNGLLSLATSNLKLF